MATKGRKPKPEAIKKLGGRSHKKKEPPLVELPIDALTDAGDMAIPGDKELWGSLVEAGVAKKSDRQAFLRYIDMISVYMKARSDVEERGAVLDVGTKKERNNPSWRVMRQAQTELLKLEVEFGLTPSAKQRVMKALFCDNKAGGGDGYAAIRRGATP
ncbi:MAG: phage terminase small subunit P27 family [Synergistes sp.]|nr:phage terminase small subunit P27 family [Synergistes sp.]